MKTVVVALLILTAYPTFAQEPAPTAPQSVAFFDVLDLPARLDEPKLQKAADKYSLKCALVNRSGERFVGLRLTLLIVDSNSGRVARVNWNEATDMGSYSIKTFEFHPPIKDPPKKSEFFLGLEEVAGSETVWRTVDSDKLLRAYARGEQGMIPKVQKLQNKFDPTEIRAIPILLKLPPPKP